MLKIKTISDGNDEEFDRKVNYEISNGWTPLLSSYQAIGLPGQASGFSHGGWGPRTINHIILTKED